jgi:BioD-like phosphotransacetylase family protein
MESAGKTALCAGIGNKLIKKGYNLGYMKPVKISENGSINEDGDVNFVKKVLGLEDSSEKLAPISLSYQELWESMTSDTDDFTQMLKKTFTKISAGKDIVIMEGLSGLVSDNVSTLACYRIAEILNSKVIVVLVYTPGLTPSVLSRVASELGDSLLGTIINFVPESNYEIVKHNVTNAFEEAGIKVLGVLPEARSLLGIRVSELAEVLDGEVIVCPDKTDELVENIMLGAMTMDSGIDYFNRKANKAALIRGERSDMQLAALETSIKCLILTNNTRPLPVVIHNAESKRVPVMTIKKDTTGAIADIEQALVKTAFNSKQKLNKFENILDEYLDFDFLYSMVNPKD